MSTYTVIKTSDKQDLARQASEFISKQIDFYLDQKNRVKISLSGGSTPFDTYALLGRTAIPWERVDIFLGDERWVDSNDESSNALMLRKSLLSSSPGNKATFFPVPTTEFPSPEESSLAFSKLLTANCEGYPPAFDLILLGLGDDGHTASLFPGTDSLEVQDQLTTVSEGKDQKRVTLTAPIICAAKQIIFLVSGKSKQIALSRLLDPSESYLRTPAKLIKSPSEIIVLADAEASSFI